MSVKAIDGKADLNPKSATLLTVIVSFLMAICAGDAKASPVILKTSTLSVSLKGSKFRHVGALNAALSNALAKCGRAVPTKVVDDRGRIGPVTAVAVRELRSCPGWDIAGEAGSGDVTEKLWARLLPNIPPPDGFGRLFIATLTLEGTDYDNFQWNYSSIDPKAWGTWGPFGATIGEGGEIQQILAAAEKIAPNVVRDAFNAAARDVSPAGPRGLVQDLNARARYCSRKATGPQGDYELYREVVTLRNQAAGEAMRVAFCDDRRFAIWVRAFRYLGRQSEVRRAYDALYLASDKKVARYIENTREAYRHAGAAATEIDVAMGVDGQTQLSSRANLSRLAQAIRSVGAGATPVARRVAISETLPVLNGSMMDRCGRDQVFVHSAGAALPPQPVCSGVFKKGKSKGEHWDANRAWTDRASFVAEQTGLRDVDGTAIVARWNYDFDQAGPLP